MTDELQDDIEIVQEIEQTEDDSVDYSEADHQDESQDDNDSEADLAPAGEGQHKQKVKLTPEQQALFEQKTAKRVWAQKDAERKAKALEQELNALRAERVRTAAPVVPPMPEQFEDGFEHKLAERDKAIAAKGQWDTEQAFYARQHHEAEQRAQQLKQESLHTTVAEYSKRALKLGVSKEELASAGTAVAGYGINPDLAEAILNDDNGPLITTYLANNPEALEEVVNRNPAAAALYIARNIVPKLQPRKTRTTNAPEPAPVLRGNGAPPKDKYHVEGAIFK